MENNSLTAEYEPGITYKFEFPDVNVNLDALFNVNSFFKPNSMSGWNPSIFNEYYDISMIVYITVEKMQKLFGENFMDVLYKKYFYINHLIIDHLIPIPFFYIQSIKPARVVNDSTVEMKFITSRGRDLIVNNYSRALDILHTEARKELDKLTFYAIEHDLCQEPTMKKV